MANGSVSALYISGAAESTPGTPGTLNRRFRFTDCGLVLQEEFEVDDAVSGIDGDTIITRTGLKAGGSFAGYLTPDAFALLVKAMLGNPTSGAHAPSSTVYDHVWTAVPAVVPTHTFQKIIAGISTHTERFAGCAVKSIGVNCQDGKIALSAEIVGLGVMTQGVAEPTVTHSADAYLVGVNSNLTIVSTALAAGVLHRDWAFSLDVMHDLQPMAGSTDFTQTLIDKSGTHKISLDFMVKELTRAQVDIFLAETHQAFTITCNGPTIDVPNTLKSQVILKLERGRYVDSADTVIGKHGMYSVKRKVVGLVDTSSLKSFTITASNLTASYAT